MRNFNFIRPLWVVAIALLVNLFVTNLLRLLGSTPESADTVGFLSMIIAAFVTFNVLNKRRKKK
jgi:hypothetical protein